MEHNNLDGDENNDDDGAGSSASIGSSRISLVSSQDTGSRADSSTSRTYHQLESEVARLTFDLDKVRQSEISIKAQYQKLVDDHTTEKVARAEGNLHPGTSSLGVSRVDEHHSELGERSEEDGGSSVASFDSALDDGAAATDPRAVAAAAVSESARLRKELGMTRAEAAAALAMEHGKRTAVVEAHRTALATTVRQAAEIRDAQEEIISLRRRLSFEAVRPTNHNLRLQQSNCDFRLSLFACVGSRPGLSLSSSSLWQSRMRRVWQHRLCRDNVVQWLKQRRRKRLFLQGGSCRYLLKP